MTKTERFLAAIQKLLSKSRTITILAIKIRNQCNQIITQRLSIKNMSPFANGEYLLLNSIIPICDSFFDIGANKGEWTAYILDNKKKDKSRFFLYEPGVAAFNISTNRFKDFSNVEMHQMAVSDTIGKLKFYEQINAGELSSAIEKWADGPVSSIEVETTTIDSELQRLSIDYLDYAKIDTEGFDLKVLKGANNSIRNKRIGFIQFEYNRVWAMSGSTLQEAYEILEECGYKVFLLKPDGLYTYDVRKYGEFYAFSNFFAIAPQNILSLKSLIKGAA